MPEITSFGVLGVFLTVVPGANQFRILLSELLIDKLMIFAGLLVGAVISKNIASFLEENDLFVPDEDDEDWTSNWQPSNLTHFAETKAFYVTNLFLFFNSSFASKNFD